VAEAGTPDFVYKLARKEYAAVHSADQKEGEVLFVAEFARGFLQGFTSPKSELWSAMHGGFWHGHHVGQTYFAEHPESVDSVMSGFGYEKIEAYGKWDVGFEVCTFIPDDGSHDGLWSLSSFGAEWPKGTEVRPGEYVIHSMRLHVAGYLSPPGRYGHLGYCPREIFATTIEEIRANKAVDPTPGNAPRDSGGSSEG